MTQPTTEDLAADVAALRAEVQRLRAELEHRSGRGMVIPRAVTAPVASEVTRSLLYVTEGAAGVADRVFVVVKDVADVYSAFQVVP